MNNIYNEIIYKEYESKYDLDILNIWNSEVGFIYPISLDMFNQNIHNKYLFNKGSFVAIYEGKVIGFILTKLYDKTNYNNTEIMPKYLNTSWISLIFVLSKYRKLKIGYNLVLKYENSIEEINRLNKESFVNKIIIGSDLDCFFPGIPNDFDNLTDVFFRKMGYTVSYYTHDCVKFLGDNESVILNEINDNFEYRYLKKTDKDIFVSFLQEQFFGRWLYEALEYFNDDQIFEEYLIVLDKDKVVGFLRTNKGLIDKISYNINWKERFNKLVGFGPLGVAREYRHMKIATSLILFAIDDVKKKGYTDILIDWTGLNNFYQKFGFQVWKCYQYGHKIIN